MSKLRRKAAAREGLSWMRLSGLVVKEVRQTVRDPSSIAIAFVLPLILLFIFGYGVSLDAKNVRLALVVEAPSPQSMSFVQGFYESEYFQPTRFAAIQEAEEAMRARKVDGIVWLRSDFDDRLLSGRTAPVGVFLNGVDANTARVVKGYLQGVWTRWLTVELGDQGRLSVPPIEVEQRVWFNSRLRSRDFLVPGLIAVIMSLIGGLLTALVVAREWERGTMESLLSTRVQVGEILLSKLLTYFALGMGGLLMSVGMAVWLFDVPLRGSFWLLMAASSLFLLAALGLGLLISTLTKNQFAAGQAAIVATFLPAFILSGFIFEIESMPLPIQQMTRILAARYYVSILQSVFVAGNVWSVIGPNLGWLAVMAGVFLFLVRAKTNKRLE